MSQGQWEKPNLAGGRAGGQTRPGAEDLGRHLTPDYQGLSGALLPLETLLCKEFGATAADLAVVSYSYGSQGHLHVWST